MCLQHFSTILRQIGTDTKRTYGKQLKVGYDQEIAQSERNSHYKNRGGKTLSKFYRRHYELISKFNVGLKTLLREGLSEPEFHGDISLQI